MVSVPAELWSALRLWQRNADNAAVVSQLYALDAWLKPPCSPVRKGRPAIVAQWRESLSRSGFSVALEPERFDLSAERDIAIERGEGQYLQLVGGVPFGTNVDYLRVWKKVQGTWLIAVDFSSGGPCHEDG